MIGTASVHRALLITGKKGARGRIWAFEAEHRVVLAWVLVSHSVSR